MRHAHEKAIEVATALTAAQIKSQSLPILSETAEDLAEYYLALEAKLADGFEKIDN